MVGPGAAVFGAMPPSLVEPEVALLECGPRDGCVFTLMADLLCARKPIFWTRGCEVRQREKEW